MTRILGLDGAFDSGLRTAPVDPNISAGSLLLYDFARADCWDGDPAHSVHNLIGPQATTLTGGAQDGGLDGPAGNIRLSSGALQIGRDLTRLKVGATSLIDYMVGKNIAVAAFTRSIDAPVLRKWVPGMTVVLGDVLYHTITPTLVGNNDIRDVWTVTQSGTWDGVEPQYFGLAEHAYGSAKAIRGVVNGDGPTYGIAGLGHVLGLASAAPLDTTNYQMEYAFLSGTELIELAKINATATSATEHLGSFTSGVTGGRGIASMPVKKQLSFYAEDFSNPMFNAVDGLSSANTQGPRLSLYRLHLEDLGLSGRPLAAFLAGEREAFARISPARGLLASS